MLLYSKTTIGSGVVIAVVDDVVVCDVAHISLLPKAGHTRCGVKEVFQGTG